MSTRFVPDPGRSWRPFFRADRETVVACFQDALRRRNRLSGPDRQLLEAHLQSAGVRGSRPGRLPNKNLAIGLADLCLRDKDIGNQVIPIVVRLWMESKSDLRTRIEQSLRSNNLDMSVVTSSSLGFEGDWSPDSYREMTSQIHAENINEAPDAVDLMIYCLTGRAPMVAEEWDHEFQAAPIEIDFDEWLSTLRDVPETSKLWDAYNRFSKTATDIYIDKRRLAILGPVFRDFRAETGAMQGLFGCSDCESWKETDFDFSVLEQVADDLRTVIAKLHVLNRPLSSSYKEQISEFEERKAAGQIVAETYARLSALRNQNSASHGPATPRIQDPEATTGQVGPNLRMPLIGAIPSRDIATDGSRTSGRELESPTGRPTAMRRLAKEERRGLTAGPGEAISFYNQPASRETGSGASRRYRPKSGAARDILTKSKTSVATWQRWEKAALDRKFMIVIGILGILALGTTIAIVGITRRLLTERQKSPETRSMVEGSTPTKVATATLKVDGSHFSGTVIRRENNSVTMLGAGGFVRTFRENELSDIKYTAANSLTDPSRVSDTALASRASDRPGAATAHSAADRAIDFARGAEFPIRSVGFLDSSSASPGAIFVGVTDSDVKNPAGKVLIPEGANVTFGLLENKKIDGRISMSFELDSADFYGRHYVISSASGKLGPSITVAVAGAKEGSPEAKARGLNVHLDNQYYMEFRAAMPVTFRLSE